MKTLHWFREDLRIMDNEALYQAAQKGQVAAVYIYPEGLGAASYWWLHKSLEVLSKSLKDHGLSLILRKGEPEKVLHELSHDLAVDCVTWNRVYSPKGVEQGKAVKAALKEQGIATSSYNSQLLIEPTQVLNKQGGPFKVFTPFWRHCRANLQVAEVLPEPTINALTHNLDSDTLTEWGLLPTKPNWAKEFDPLWQPGEAGAQAAWETFLQSKAAHYANGRDTPHANNTSLLSPHLTFGEISVRQLWHETLQSVAFQELDSTNGDKFLAELGWREYSRYLLMHFPDLETSPFNKRFEHFPWDDDSVLISAWQQGKTGYPIVDAGMRELWQTGYMHNRVRMITASFLTKHCLSHWKHGMAWFWDTLLDADVANNTASWQWVSGCGADASPYFRVFNPILQGEKFDANGEYSRKWLPELNDLPNKFLHKPWEADTNILNTAGIELGKDYPLPIVDHKEARQKALDAYQVLKTSAEKAS